MTTYLGIYSTLKLSVDVSLSYSNFKRACFGDLILLNK